MNKTCPRCGKLFRSSRDGYGDWIHTCSPSQNLGMDEQKSQGKQFVYDSGKETKEVFKTGDPLNIPASGIGLSDEDFNRACTQTGANIMASAMQELVRQAMKRVQMGDSVNGTEYFHAVEIFQQQGLFTPDELEAMAWCMRNDKWPMRT